MENNKAPQLDGNDIVEELSLRVAELVKENAILRVQLKTLHQQTQQTVNSK